MSHGQAMSDGLVRFKRANHAKGNNSDTLNDLKCQQFYEFKLFYFFQNVLKKLFFPPKIFFLM
jgi:hypothetical protein